MSKNNKNRTFRTIDASIPDEVLWKEFWFDKTAEEKLNIVEEIIRGKDAPSRLQRVFRVIERKSS